MKPIDELLQELSATGFICWYSKMKVNAEWYDMAADCSEAYMRESAKFYGFKIRYTRTEFFVGKQFTCTRLEYLK